MLNIRSLHVAPGDLYAFIGHNGAVFFSPHVLEVAQRLCNKGSIIKGGLDCSWLKGRENKSLS